MVVLHTDFVLENVARIIFYYVEPDPRLISLAIDDEWMSMSETDKEPWKIKAAEWLDLLAQNYPETYQDLVENLIPPGPKFW